MSNKTIINWGNGAVEESAPVFIDFNNYLKKLGFNIVFTDFPNTNYLSIYVHSIEDVKKAKKISFEKSSEIIDAFFSISKKYGKTLKYARTEWKDYSVNNIYSFEISCITTIIRESKPKFVKELKTQLVTKPMYVFCHSAGGEEYSNLPGYYLVFADPEDLAKIDKDTKNKIDDICNRLLIQNDKTGFYSRNKIDISYWDAITQSKSLYGMSRED